MPNGVPSACLPAGTCSYSTFWVGTTSCTRQVTPWTGKAGNRLPFRRWRFELWHGARLEAAGWRTTERDALRALRKHASRVAHGMFGLRPPADAPIAGTGFRAGATVRMLHGGIAFALVPRQLEAPPPLGGLSA